MYCKIGSERVKDEFNYKPRTEPKGVTTQMKALYEYILMAVFMLLLEKVHFFGKFYVNLRESFLVLYKKIDARFRIAFNPAFRLATHLRGLAMTELVFTVWPPNASRHKLIASKLA